MPRRVDNKAYDLRVKMMNLKINKNAFLYILFNLLSSFNSGIFNTYVGIYLKERQFNETFVGYVLSVNIFSLAIFSLIGAYVIGKIGRKKNFALSAISMAVGMVLLVTTNIEALIIFSGALIGFGLSLKTTGESMYLSENSGPTERVFIFSMNFTAFNLGWMAANFFGGQLSNALKKIMPYNSALLVVLLVGALLSALSMIPVLFMVENRRGNPRGLRECFIGYKNILMEEKKAIYFLLFNAIVGLGAGMVVPFFSVYLKYALKIDDAAVGAIMAFAQFGCVLGGLLIPFIANKLGVHKSIFICQLLSVPFLLSIAFPQGVGIVAVSFFIRSSLMNMANPLIQNLGMEMVHPLDRANLSGLMTLSNNLTRALGIFIGGYIMKNISYNVPYYFTVFFYLCSLIVFVGMYRDVFFKKNLSKNEGGLS